MRPEIHRAALRATARLAFFSSVLGCGGLTDAAAPDTSQTSADGGRETLTDGGPVLHDASDRALSDTAPEISDIDSARADSAAVLACDGADSFACCQDEVHATWPDGGGFSVDAGAETKACCQILATHYDEALHEDGGDPSAWEWGNDANIKWSCCTSINWNSTTCTPWGPPVPLAMKRPAIV
jgi:hypothetical protein